MIYVKVAIDNHQLTILNLILSCFAAMQGAIILLAAKSADAISSEVAVHTKDNTDELIRHEPAAIAGAPRSWTASTARSPSWPRRSAP